MVWYVVIRYIMCMCYGMVCCDMVYDVTDMVWYVVIWYTMCMCYGMVCCDMVYDVTVIWYGML